MSDNRVTITMTDGTTREVHPETPVRIEGGCTPFLAKYIHGGERVEVVFEPTREDWVPYEPWMRYLLTDDARVSWAHGPGERRESWAMLCASSPRDWPLRSDIDLRIRPADVPERPTEVDPNDAPDAALWSRVAASEWHAASEQAGEAQR